MNKKITSSFASEKALQKHLFNLKINLKSNYEFALQRREVPIGKCIPDFIYINFKELPNSNLLPRHCSYRHSFIIWLLKNRKKLKPIEIADLCYENLKRIEPLIEDLIKAGTIRKLKTGYITLQNKLFKQKIEVIAVEVKMYRWTEAFRQATEYLKFADRVFIAMHPEKTPKKPDSLNMIADSGIGLCEVGENELNWIIKPSLNKKQLSPDREYVIASSAAKATQTLWSSL